MLQRSAFGRHHAPVFWWNEDIAELRKICHSARRQLQRARGTPRLVTCCEAYKVARKELKTAIRDSKRECFLKLCDAAEEDPGGGAYKMVVKSINAGSRAPTDPVVLEGIVRTLFPQGRPITTSPRACTSADPKRGHGSVQQMPPRGYVPIEVEEAAALSAVQAGKAAGRGVLLQAHLPPGHDREGI
ncbi:uncharacterized protein LOC117898281 [Drosophila subobscura]|uniref:uncharacterized protein LOC117898281 n=1 Tax=Drosophila subobscura TaxID=7241 RepID=UPI00155A3B3C|nr:uncharacterized protein LOC117898281 [Drosophila subobscura]